MGRVYQALVKAGRWDGIRSVENPTMTGGSTSGSPLPFPAASFQKAVCQEPRQLFHVSGLTVDRHLASICGNDQLARERYQALAVRVSSLADKNRVKTLMIASALAAEGKTTIALNLAWSLAKPAERRVLLLEANLRRPAISRMLGISPRRAWPAIVEGSADFADTAVRLDPNRLYLLPMCQADYMARRNGKGESASQLLTSRRVEDLLADLENQFDLIIIDAPPLTDCAETQRLAAVADSTALVVRAGITHHTAVETALKLVPKERRLGIVLNVTDEEDAS